MSVRAMSWAWTQACPPTSKTVLLALADHADDDGVCWPGRQGLAQKLRITDRNVTRHLSRLQAIGLISSEARYRPDGSRTSNVYHLLGVSNMTPPLDRHVHTPSAKTSRPLGKNVETRTVIEPSRESSNKHEEVSLPEWFHPLTELHGYRRGAHSRVREIIIATCEFYQVDPTALVRSFADYWPRGQIKHRWVDPVRALRTTIDVECKKVKAMGMGVIDERSETYDPATEFAQHRGIASEADTSDTGS